MPAMPGMPAPAAPDQAAAPIDPTEKANTILSDMQSLIDAKGLNPEDKAQLSQAMSIMQDWVENMSGEPSEPAPAKPMAGSMPMEAGGNPNARPY